MIPVTSRWKDLDNAWSNKFITGAGKLGEDLSRKVKVTSSRSTHCLGELLGMTRWVTSPQFLYSGALALSLVNQERVRYAKNFEEYWTDAINECKIKEDILVYEAEEARIQDELSRLRHKLSEIQEKVKMQNSSNREMDEDSVNEDPVHDGLIKRKKEYGYERVTKKHRKNKSSSTQQSSRQTSRQTSYDNFENNRCPVHCPD
ncbi:13991_t:CDS:2 [Entrophospora sp. SA101]|nr:13991_t:CDS:2 [Entrophospora sp. SA101]